jgi:hypothetical protein
MIKIRNCPICQVPPAADCLIGSLVSNHHKQQGRQFQLAYCNCGDLIYISPAPDLSDIRAMYADSPQFDDLVYRGDHLPPPMTSSSDAYAFFWQTCSAPRAIP